MTMKRCEKGHYYDPAKHSSCPACGVPDLDIGITKAVRKETVKKKKSASTPAASSAVVTRDDDQKLTRRHGQPAGLKGDDCKTVHIFRKKTGIDPVVGWLVCIKGPDRGRDYRIRSEKNFIGRSPKMDICIHNDDTISRENHAIISFNPKTNIFKIHPGEHRGMVYLNEADVDVPKNIKAYDIIEIGQSKMIFIPFCGDLFQWED